MKNKKRFCTISVLLAAMLYITVFSIIAYAGGPNYEEALAETDISTEETAKPTTPLTPDGNLTLVDDEKANSTTEKQFITVVSKNGNYFYLVIDRTDDGEGNVHFLNLVDEADLLALIEEDNTSATQLPSTCICKDKCTPGYVDTTCPVCKNDVSGCKGLDTDTKTETVTEKSSEKNTGGLLLILLVLGLAGGGALYYIKFLKPKQSGGSGDGLEDFDFEEEEYEEEEPEDTDLEDQTNTGNEIL